MKFEQNVQQKKKKNTTTPQTGGHGGTVGRKIESI